jgi:hypothetical protein
VTQGLFVEQVTLLALARGIANHARGAAHQENGLMAAVLQMAKHHDAAKVSDMQGVGGRVSTKVGRHHFFLEEFFRSWHHLCQHSAPAEFFNKIFHRMLWFLFWAQKYEVFQLFGEIMTCSPKNIKESLYIITG